MGVEGTKTGIRHSEQANGFGRGNGYMGSMGEGIAVGRNATGQGHWMEAELGAPAPSAWEERIPVRAATDLPHTFILGLPFFTGTAREAVDRMMGGGLLVVPSAPTLKDIPSQPAYRAALLSADLIIPDSAYMVLIWNFLEHKRLRRLSGLEYIRELLRRPELQQPGSTVWIMAGPRSAALNLACLRTFGINVPESHVYTAPMYGPADGSELSDPALLALIDRLRPAHVVVTVGGGTQERLGLYLRTRLSYVPGIHCIGAAIAFLSGDQTSIPVWADHLYLGWLFRVFENPKRYGPRYWSARGLLWMILK